MNWHHFFIDITERDPKKLVSVLLEPEEAGRCPKGPKPPNIRPLGVSSAFDKPIENLVKISNDYQNHGIMDPKIRKTIFENIATRGYNPQVPTFDILSHALISAQIYTAAFHNAQSTLASVTRWQHKSVRDLDHLLQTLASWTESDEETMADFHNRFGGDLLGIRQGIMNYSAMDQGYTEEVERLTQDIPRPADMLNALPESILPTPHRFHGQLAYVAYNGLDYNTLGGFIIRINAPKG